MIETYRRTLTKTVTWRLTGSLSTLLITYLVTGNLTAAATVFGIHFVTNTTLYFFHERMWNNIQWGKTYENHQ